MTRRIGEALRIGDEVTVTVLGVKTGNQVSIGIRAPRFRNRKRQRVQTEAGE